MLEELLQYVMCGACALPVVGGFAWLIRKGLQQQREFEAMVARRGWTPPPGPRPTYEENVVAKGVHHGVPFEVTVQRSRSKSGNTTTRVKVESRHGLGEVLVTPPVPDTGFMGGLVKMMFGRELPPRWEGAPAELQGSWELRGPAGLAQRVCSPALVAALTRWDRRKSGQPWVEVKDGRVVLHWQRATYDEAELVALVELAIAASGLSAA